MNTNTPENGSNELDFSKNHINNNFYLENKNEITLDFSSKESAPNRNYFFKNILDKDLSVSQMDVANILIDLNRVNTHKVNASIKSVNGNEEKNKSIISSVMIDLKEESSYDIQKVNTDYKTKKLESTINRDISRKIDEKRIDENIEIKKSSQNSVSKFHCGSCDIF